MDARWTVATPPESEPVTLAEAKSHLRADSSNDQDILITSLIQAAREHIEQVCERALMPQAWRVSLDAFPAGAIEIPGGLVRSITSVVYFDAVAYVGTYVRTGSSVVVTMASHGFVAGDSVPVSAAADSGLNGGQTVTAVTAGSFTFVDADATGAASGSLTVTGRRQTLTGYQADLDRQPARLLPSGTWPATQSDRANAVQITAAVGYADASKVPAALKAALLLLVGDLYENREAAIVGAPRVDNPAVQRLLMPHKRIVP